MITSRFNEKIPLYLIFGLILSFATSLFLMQLFIGALSILWICEKWENKRKAFDKIGIIVLVFGGVRILSILFSEYFAVSVESFYKEALFYFAYFSLNYYLKIFDEKKIILISVFFIIAAAVISLTGIIQFNLGLVKRAESFSSGYGIFSTFLLAGLGFGLMFSAEGRGNILKYKVLANSVILAGIVTSLGRTNIVIAGLLLISALLLKKIKIYTAAAIIFLAVIFLLISFSNNDAEAKMRADNPVQLSDRNILYKGAMELLLDHPFLGFGPRTFKKIFPLQDQLVDRNVGGWHNDYLQIYIESGLLGLISFFVLLYLIIYYMVVMLKKENKKEISSVLWGILFSICGFILTTLTGGFITSVVLSIVFVFIVSILSSIVYKTKTRELHV
jgi:O-antigen ligase